MPDASEPLRTVIFGARPDGSAKVLLDIIRTAAVHEVVGFLDDDPARAATTIAGLRVLGGSDQFAALHADGVRGIAFALGSNRGRHALLDKARAAGLQPIVAIHPSAVVAADVTVAPGVWMAAGAIVNPGVRVGEGAVINTGATVDHDSVIGDYANISPGCRLSGRTIIGRYAFLGTGAITLPDAWVGDDAVVGAGAVVLKQVAAGATAVGVPAHTIHKE